MIKAEGAGWEEEVGSEGAEGGLREGGTALGESFKVKVIWEEQYLPINNKAEIVLLERLFLMIFISLRSLEKNME